LDCGSPAAAFLLVEPRRADRWHQWAEETQVTLQAHQFIIALSLRQGKPQPCASMRYCGPPRGWHGKSPGLGEAPRRFQIRFACHFPHRTGQDRPNGTPHLTISHHVGKNLG
jgi:hypothetical protein